MIEIRVVKLNQLLQIESHVWNSLPFLVSLLINISMEHARVIVWIIWIDDLNDFGDFGDLNDDDDLEILDEASTRASSNVPAWSILIAMSEDDRIVDFYLIHNCRFWATRTNRTQLFVNVPFQLRECRCKKRSATSPSLEQSVLLIWGSKTSYGPKLTKHWLIKKYLY